MDDGTVYHNLATLCTSQLMVGWLLQIGFITAIAAFLQHLVSRVSAV